MKKLPWVSLLLVVIAYTLFGWNSAVSQYNWVEGATLVLGIALFLIAPVQLIKICFSRWLASDARAFISIIILSFLTVVVLTWLSVFAQFFILLSAGILARFDLQTAGYGPWKAFGILVVISSLSFAFGMLTNILWTRWAF